MRHSFSVAKPGLIIRRSTCRAARREGAVTVCVRGPAYPLRAPPQGLVLTIPLCFGLPLPLPLWPRPWPCPDQRKPTTAGPIFPTRWARGCQLIASFGFPTAATTAPYITFITVRIMADSRRPFFSTTLIGPTIDTRPITSFPERISARQGGVVRIVPIDCRHTVLRRRPLHHQI
jgi:hypothetical protein